MSLIAQSLLTRELVPDRTEIDVPAKRLENRAYIVSVLCTVAAKLAPKSYSTQRSDDVQGQTAEFNAASSAAKREHMSYASRLLFAPCM
jgi:hypothetical protein